MTTPQHTITTATAVLEKHLAVVTAAISYASEDLRQSAARSRTNAARLSGTGLDTILQRHADTRLDEAAVMSGLGNDLESGTISPAYAVQRYWDLLLTAVVRREAADLVLVAEARKWLDAYPGRTADPVYGTRSAAYMTALDNVTALADVKHALTAMREAHR
jgi:hypothetical protein